MSFDWYFILPYPPTLNTYYRMYNGKMLISAKGRAYRKEVGKTLMLPSGSGLKWDGKPLIGDLEVSLFFILPDRRKRDLDNLLKAVFDALQYNGLYKDDSKITKIVAEKVYPDYGVKGVGYLGFSIKKIKPQG